MRIGYRAQWIALLLTLVATGAHGPLAAQGKVAIQRIAPDIAFARIIATELGVDGRICVADDIEVKITCLSPEGRVLWTYGRKGGGPGEFQGLYRIALAPDLTMLVADFTTNELHRISPSGAYLGKARFPSGFGQMNSLVAISRDTLAFSGTLWRPESARTAGVHLFVFRDTIAYLRSFGDLPVAKDPEKVRMSGSGPVTLTAKGTLLYSRRFPYEVTEYTLTGTKLRSVLNPMPTLGPDDAMTIERSGSRITYRSGPPRSGGSLVLAAREVGNGNWWVARRITGGDQFFDIVDPRTGRWTAPVKYPPWGALLGIAGEDRKRGLFIASTECDDEPCLVRFPSRPFIGR